MGMSFFYKRKTLCNLTYPKKKNQSPWRLVITNKEHCFWFPGGFLASGLNVKGQGTGTAGGRDTPLGDSVLHRLFSPLLHVLAGPNFGSEALIE